MKHILILTLVVFTFSNLKAQKKEFTPSEQEVVDVIKKFFDAMRAGDSTSLRATFHETARMQTTFNQKDTGEPQLRTEESPDNFVKAVGTPHDKVFNEVILDYSVKIDDNLAVAWTPYEFYLGEEFSHCGVNVFQMFKSKEGWKIIYIADTRRRKGCKE